MKFSFKLDFKYYTLILFGLSLPFIEFVNKNLGQIDYVIIKDTFKLFFLSILIFTTSYIPLKKLFKNKYNQIVIFSFLQYFFFKFSTIKHFFEKNKISLDGEISILIIIIIFIIFFKIRFKTKIILFLNYYIFIYFFLIIALITFNVLQNSNIFVEKKNFKIDDNNLTKKIYFEKTEISNIKNQKNKNIYLVIFDGMTSLEEFIKQNKELEFDLNKAYTKLEKLDLNYIKNSKSVFTTSHLTFSSIFNLNPIVTPESERYFNRLKFFPANLLNKNSPNYPILLDTLFSINYKFKWVGTPWADCVSYNEKFCLSYDDNTQKNNLEVYYKLNPKNNYVIDYFNSLTIIKPIIFNIRKIFFKQEKYFQWEYRTNDGIEKFLDSVVLMKNFKKENHFFYIHHMAPHWPYVYNKNCTERIDDVAKSSENNFIGYKESYLCVLKKIEKFMTFIKNNDAEALVIIQGDHGFEFDSTGGLKKTGFTKENAIKRLTHFNAIKINKECKKYLSNNIGNVNAIRLTLSCATNQAPKLIEEEHFIGFYETQDNFGKVINLKNFK